MGVEVCNAFSASIGFNWLQVGLRRKYTTSEKHITGPGACALDSPFVPAFSFTLVLPFHKPGGHQLAKEQN